MTIIKDKNMQLRGDFRKNRIVILGLDCEELSDEQWQTLTELTYQMQEKLKIVVWVQGFSINGGRPTSEEPIMPSKEITRTKDDLYLKD